MFITKCNYIIVRKLFFQTEENRFEKLQVVLKLLSYTLTTQDSFCFSENYSTFKLFRKDLIESVSIVFVWYKLSIKVFLWKVFGMGLLLIHYSATDCQFSNVLFNMNMISQLF